MSKATVSRVINGRTEVAAATRARVQQMLAERNYVPPQRSSAAVELIEPLSGLAQLGEVLYRGLVCAAVGLAGRHPQPLDTGITRRELAAQSDESQTRARHRPHHAAKRAAAKVQPSQIAGGVARFPHVTLTAPAVR